MLVGLLCAALAPAGSKIMVGAAFIMFGIGWAVSYFFSIYYALTVPHSHAKSGGIHEAVLGMGNLIGPFAAVAIITLTAKTNLLAPSSLGRSALIFAVATIALSILLQLTYTRSKINN